MSGVAAWLSRFAVAVGRSSAETSKLDDRASTQARVALFVAMSVVFGAIYFPSVYRAMGPSVEYRPTVEWAARDWKFLPEASPAPCGARADDPRCLANPRNRALWASRLTHADPDHSQKLRALGEGFFWLGVEIPRALLRKARSLQANRIVIGSFNSKYRVWLDGELVLDANGWYQSHPLYLVIPMERLEREEPLHLAVEVHNDGLRLDPDQLNESSGEGFYDNERFSSFMRAANVQMRGRPLALFLTYFIFALVFFGFWLPSRGKPEYFYIALYALMCAFNQARYFDLFWSTVSVMTYERVALVISCYATWSGMFAGFAFARLRRAVFAWGLPVALAIPLVAVAVAGSSTQLQTMRVFFRIWLIGPFYLAGAVACFVQAVRWRRGGKRQLQLLLYAACFSAISWLEGGSHAHNGGELNYLAWLGTEHLFLVLLLGGAALKEIREQVNRVERTPVSEYHRREILPSSISGALLLAEFNAAGDPALAQAWRTHFYAAVLDNGGFVLHHKGSEVMAFFDKDKRDNPIESALLALDDVATDLMTMELEYRSRSAGPLSFRASVTPGAVCPVWENVGGTREPYWEEAGDSTPFVAAARLFEMGSKIDLGDASRASVVYMRDEQVASLLESKPGLAARFSARAVSARDKHGNAYRIAIYRPVGQDDSSAIAA
jgi:hypothetical protein